MNVNDWLKTMWSWILWLRNRLFTDETRISALEGKVKTMSDALDAIKSDFEAYQALVNTTLTNLNAKITSLTTGALDPAKAEAIDTEIKAAITALTPPAPAAS